MPEGACVLIFTDVAGGSGPSDRFRCCESEQLFHCRLMRTTVAHFVTRKLNINLSGQEIRYGTLHILHHCTPHCELCCGYRSKSTCKIMGIAARQVLFM